MTDPNNTEARAFSVGRRGLVKGLVGLGAVPAMTSAAATQPRERPAPTVPAAPSAVTAARETEVPVELPRLTTDMTGSDFMVDALKTLDIDYISSLPGSTFRGLHESIINYGDNKKPEFLTCLHEEAAVAMAHGYAKVAGKPMAAMVHGVVGLQHASMAVYNAYADRVPILLLTGSNGDGAERQPGAEWYHSAQDGAAMVRDFTKWDDQPGSLQAFADSMVRGYSLATTVPMAPVLLTADVELQERPLSRSERARLRIPRLGTGTQPQGDGSAVQEVAKLLLAAENPVIFADRYARTTQGMPLLIQLAELLQAPVVDLGTRMNFPNLHPLNHSPRRAQLAAQADVIFALEPVDLAGLATRFRDQLNPSILPAFKPDAKIITLGTGNLLMKSNLQEIQRYSPANISLVGDAEATMPALIDAVRRDLSDNRRGALLARGQKLAEIASGFRERALSDAAYGWDASPISTARMCMELWEQIRNDDWALMALPFFASNWPLRLWNIDKPYHHTGSSGAYGIGYLTPASVGAALASKGTGRLFVSITTDGDLMMSPGALWTAAHHKIPILFLVHNNRAYHQETMHVQRMANRHNRGIERARIGTTITDPNIDFAKMAQSMGVYAERPVTDPRDLGPAIRRAIANVRRGEPALLDVVTQPR